MWSKLSSNVWYSFFMINNWCLLWWFDECFAVWCFVTNQAIVSLLYIYNKKITTESWVCVTVMKKEAEGGRCYVKICFIRVQRADSTITGCDIILVTVHLLWSVLPHKASNKKKVNVMTQKSTNRYMQRSAQRQQWSQLAEGRRPQKDVHLRRAITQFVHKKPQSKKKNIFWLTCPQRAACKYSYSSCLCLLFSWTGQICLCVSVLKTVEGNWNKDAYTKLNVSSKVWMQLQRLDKGTGKVFYCVRT